jgi:hypothetical protein
MGVERRADGLLETAGYLRSALQQMATRGLAIGDISVADQAINKIPGVTRTSLRVASEDKRAVATTLRMMSTILAKRNQQHAASASHFDSTPLAIQEVALDPEAAFFPPEQILLRQMAALALTQTVNEAAMKRAHQKVVATVGTYQTTTDGMIELGLDVRGIDKPSRDATLRQIKRRAKLLHPLAQISFGKALPGSGDPVVLDEYLVETATRAIGKYKIGSSVVMFSAAGHDVQNAVRAGTRGVMLFVPSRNGGLAHRPEAYSSPADLENGVKALAALTMELAG